MPRTSALGASNLPLSCTNERLYDESIAIEEDSLFDGADSDGVHNEEDEDARRDAVQLAGGSGETSGYDSSASRPEPKSANAEQEQIELNFLQAYTISSALSSSKQHQSTSSNWCLVSHVLARARSIPSHTQVVSRLPGGSGCRRSSLWRHRPCSSRRGSLQRSTLPRRGPHLPRLFTESPSASIRPHPRLDCRTALTTFFEPDRTIPAPRAT